MADLNDTGAPPASSLPGPSGTVGAQGARGWSSIGAELVPALARGQREWGVGDEDGVPYVLPGSELPDDEHAVRAMRIDQPGQ